MTDPGVFVVRNPVAGSRADIEKLSQLLEQRLGASGRPYHIHSTGPEEDPAEVVRAACERGVERVIAAGGDGTVGAVVNGMVGTAVPLGIIPVGTGNILARVLGIPLDAAKALEIAMTGVGDPTGKSGAPVRGRRTYLDLMQVAGRYYVLNVSVGVSAHSIRDTSRLDKRRFGMFAYALRVAGHLFGFQEYRLKLSVDGQKRTVQATEVLVSNGEVLEHVSTLLGSVATFQDGRIEAYVVHGTSLLDYAVVAVRKLTGTVRAGRHYEHTPVTSRITITAGKHPLPVQGDGEVIGHTPVTIAVIPQGVNVMLPAVDT
ncbi:MAG: diacylglycerol kinase family protein [Spirochaeta sp.]|nr:diacylglycerol kinase family protein [Spirochaeta sp.]